MGTPVLFPQHLGQLWLYSGVRLPRSTQKFTRLGRSLLSGQKQSDEKAPGQTCLYTAQPLNTAIPPAIQLGVQGAAGTVQKPPSLAEASPLPLSHLGHPYIACGPDTQQTQDTTSGGLPEHVAELQTLKWGLLLLRDWKCRPMGTSGQPAGSSGLCHRRFSADRPTVCGETHGAGQLAVCVTKAWA